MHARMNRLMITVLILLAVLFDCHGFSEDGLSVEFFSRGGKYGIKSKTSNETMIQPTFDSYGEWFMDASVEDGFEDYSGLSEREMSVFYAKIWSEGRCGLIDSEGRLLLQPQWDDIEEVISDYAIVVQNGRQGVCTLSDEVIANPEWEQIMYVRDDRTFYVTCERDGDYYEGTLKADGSIGIPAIYEQLEPIKEGMTFYKEDGLWGIISENGDIITKPQFERMIHSLCFSEGLAAVGIHGSIGYVDNYGHFAIPAQYGLGRPFKDGYAIVADQQLSLYGIIDKLGNEIVPLIWQSISYSEEVGYKLTDKNGEQVCFDSIQSLVDAMPHLN